MLGPNDCTFDVDADMYCTWAVDATANLVWRRNSGSTPSSSTGPEKDHTSGSGIHQFGVFLLYVHI